MTALESLEALRAAIDLLHDAEYQVVRVDAAWRLVYRAKQHLNDNAAELIKAVMEENQ
jgi:hypothetical protein